MLIFSLFHFSEHMVKEKETQQYNSKFIIRASSSQISKTQEQKDLNQISEVSKFKTLAIVPN